MRAQRSLRTLATPADEWPRGLKKQNVRRETHERSLPEDQEEWVNEPLSLVSSACKPVNPLGFLS